jgi:hypothetical protein
MEKILNMVEFALRIVDISPLIVDITLNKAEKAQNLAEITLKKSAQPIDYQYYLFP